LSASASPSGSLAPSSALPGGRIVCHGRFPVGDVWPVVTIGQTPARVASLSPQRLVIIVPPDVFGVLLPVTVDGTFAGTVSVGEEWVTGVHQVDSPLVGSDGCLYATASGTRDQEASVSLFRVAPDGAREPFATGIRNPTSVTSGPDGTLFVSSRFEGKVFRVLPDGATEVFASELGVPCGLAWGQDGVLYVGDRSGSILRVEHGRATTFAQVPASVAAFHLAVGPDGDLVVAAPTLASCDGLYAIDPRGNVSRLPWRLGRPQGLAFDAAGVLHVADSLAGSAGVFRLVPGAEPAPVLSGDGVLGLAFGPRNEVAVATSQTVYRFPHL
jgi:glucose/arabinose dehydrogenase